MMIAPRRPSSVGRGRHAPETAMSENSDERLVFKVLLNDEEQYSLWPDDREIPNGWREAGKSGTKAECLAYIEEVWTDMRPKSLRDRSDRS